MHGAEHSNPVYRISSVVSQMPTDLAASKRYTYPGNAAGACIRRICIDIPHRRDNEFYVDRSIRDSSELFIKINTSKCIAHWLSKILSFVILMLLNCRSAMPHFRRKYIVSAHVLCMQMQVLLKVWVERQTLEFQSNILHTCAFCIHVMARAMI